MFQICSFLFINCTWAKMSPNTWHTHISLLYHFLLHCCYSSTKYTLLYLLLWTFDLIFMYVCGNLQNTPCTVRRHTSTVQVKFVAITLITTKRPQLVPKPDGWASPWSIAWGHHDHSISPSFHQQIKSYGTHHTAGMKNLAYQSGAGLWKPCLCNLVGDCCCLVHVGTLLSSSTCSWIELNCLTVFWATSSASDQ